MHLQLKYTDCKDVWCGSKQKEEIIFSIGLCCEVKFQFKPVAHKSVRESYDIRIKE